jgi:two-component system OmpR family response regulator
MATIVICEDDPSIQRLVRASLASTGHDLHVAADGEQGLALIASIRPAFVITDLSMPKLDGIAMAQRLRATPDLAEIPVMFLSASLARVRDITESSVRAVAILKKPFSPSELRALVLKHVPASTLP